MRLLSLIALAAFVCSGVISATPNADKLDVAELDSEIARLSRELAADIESNNVKQSLRGTADDLDDPDAEEERAPLGAVAKLENAVSMTAKEKQVASNALKEFEHAAATSKETKQKLTAKLSSQGLHKDAGTGAKIDAGLVSRVGRDIQRYDGDRRLLSCSVISRAEGTHTNVPGTGNDVMLISSSRPAAEGKPEKWILPKGGWDADETITASATREIWEEAGIVGEFVGGLGKYNFLNREEKPYRYYGFRVTAKKALDDWPESSRRRIFVSFDDAMEKLKDRPDMVHMVKRAKVQAFLEAKIAARAVAAT